MRWIQSNIQTQNVRNVTLVKHRHCQCKVYFTHQPTGSVVFTFNAPSEAEQFKREIETFRSLKADGKLKLN
jgi:hypothetical protein